MRVRDVMRKEVRTINPNETASTAKELFRRYDIRHLVVVDRKNVIGLLADRDLIDVGGDTPVQRAMAHPAVTIAPDETVRKAAALMTGHVIGSLPVVDDAKLVGIVTTFVAPEPVLVRPTRAAVAADVVRHEGDVVATERATRLRDLREGSLELALLRTEEADVEHEAAGVTTIRDHDLRLALRVAAEPRLP